MAVVVLAFLGAVLVACSPPGAGPSALDPDSSASTITSSHEAAPLGEPFMVTVQLRDADGGPLPRAGQLVTFVATSGELSPAALDGGPETTETTETDDEGRASVTLTPTSPGTITVRAYVGEGELGASLGSVSVTVSQTGVEVDAQIVTYDGAPKRVTPRFYPPDAIEGATIVYALDGAELDGPPSDAGVYTVTVTAGNGYDESATATLTIEPRALTVDGVSWMDKTYDGTTDATATASLVKASVVDGDDVRLADTLEGTFASALVGTHDVEGRFVLAGAHQLNYRIHPQPAGTATITKANVTLTITPHAGQAKLIGDPDPVFTYEHDGFMFGDDESLLTGLLARAGGEDAGVYPFALGTLSAGVNYQLDLAGEATFAVSGVILEGATVTYDGTPQALTAAFAPAGAERGATVTYEDASGTISTEPPTGVGTYTVTATAGPGYPGSSTATLVIEPVALTVGDVEFADKEYDAATGATLSATLVTTNIVSGDDVRLVDRLVGTFASANVGVHDVVGNIELTGTDAGNYLINQQPSGQAEITSRSVTLQTAVAADKTYDADDAAGVDGSLDGIRAADVATIGFEGTFAQASVGTAIPVTVALTGDAAGNYALVDPALTAAITARAITITVTDPADKTFGDALTLGTSSTGFTVSNLASGESVDQVTLASAGADAQAIVGSYGVEASAATGTLFDPANYDVTYLAGTLAVVARPITITGTVTSWTYGDEPATGDLAPVVDSGSLPAFATLTGAVERTDTSVGTTATFQRGSLDIVDAGTVSLWSNFEVAYAPYEITPRPATITATYAVDKTYGETIDLSVVGSTLFTVTGLAAGESVDQVVFSSDGFAAGAPITGDAYGVDVSDPTGSTFDAANYDLTFVPGSVTVVAREVTIEGSFTVAERAYDGTATAPIDDASSLVLVNTVDGDDVALAPVAAYQDGSVGEAKPVTLTAASSLVGTDAGNYALSLVGAPTSTGTIVKDTITFDVTIAGTDGAKTVMYDGGTTFQPNVVSSVDPVPSTDPVAFIIDIRYGSATGPSRGSFRDVGTYTVTVTADDPRYEGTSVHGDLEVLAREIVIAGSNTGKTFGDIDPELLPLIATTSPNPFGNGDAFSVGSELSYAGSDDPYLSVGTYDFDLGDVTILRNGADVTSNYAISFETSFEITERPLTITPDAVQSKTYGDVEPAFAHTASGFAGTDDASILTGELGREEGESVGTYAYTLGSLDAGVNYALSIVPEAATFDITQRPLSLTAGTTTVTYGDGGHDLTAQIASGTLRDGDALTGSLAMPDGNVGTWTFGAGNAVIGRDGSDVSANYALTYASYVVEARPATIVPAADQGKTYGDADPVFAYTIENRVEGDELTGTLGREKGEDVGTYAFTLGGLANANYVLSLPVDPAPATFAITPRPITLGATVDTKEYSDPDPDLSPVLLDATTLRDGDVLTGVLAHDGVDANASYDLSLGTVTIDRAGTDVRANYAISFGTFTIVSKPVSFDITNSDFTIDDGDSTAHVFKGDGKSAIRGLEVTSDPAGMQSFTFSYRRTHDENHAPVPAGQQSVQNINLLGSYVVTVTATDDNYEGATPLDVWVTDATHVAFTDASPSEVMVGGTATLTAELRNDAGEARHAGTVGIPLDLAASGPEISFRDAQTGTDVTTTKLLPGAVSVDVTISANALTTVPVDLIATAVTDPTGSFTAATTSVTPTAALALTADWNWEVPVGIESPTITVGLIDANGGAVAVPAGGSSLAVSLDSSPNDVTFNVAGAPVTEVSIAAGSSSAMFTLSSATPGSTTVTTSHAGTYHGIEAASATLLITELTASDDGPISVVGGGDLTLSIQADLLANDVWTGSTGWSFGGIVSETIVTTQVSGDALIVSAPSDAGGSSGSFTYQIRDDVYGTTATATVHVDVTYPPTDAILFTQRAEFDDFISTKYEPPTFQTIFAEWPRFDGGTYYASASDAPVGSNAEAWTLDGSNVYQPKNASPPTGFVSPDAFEYYTFEATLASSSYDNDSIGLVLAYDENGAGAPRYLVAVRGQNQTSSLAPDYGWGLWYYDGTTRTPIVEPNAGLTGYAGWGDNTSQLHYARVGVTRTGDNVTLRTTQFQGSAGFQESDYVAATEITVNLATGEVQNGGVQSTHTALTSLSGAQSYGYWSYSQPYTTFLDVNFQGGADLETAILLETPTTIDGTDAWTGSQIWRFSNDTWTQDVSATIQSELGFPRNVTSIAEPNPGSAYTTYSVFGHEFRVQETEVLLLNP